MPEAGPRCNFTWPVETTIRNDLQEAIEASVRR